MELKQNIQVLSYVLQSLLIVPYGIETLLLLLPCGFLTVLLIVPYGIETISIVRESGLQISFNRTLWN